MQLEERKNIEETMEELDEDEYLSEEDEEEINLENKNKYHSYEINVIKMYLFQMKKWVMIFTR